MSNGKKLTKRRIKKENNDCFWMESIFCLESHIHLCSRHISAIPAYVIKTCVTWHAISGTRYWGFVSPKLHVSTYRNQQHCWWFHNYCDVIMGTIVSQITGFTIVYSAVYSGADQRKHQSSTSLAFVRGIHWDRWIPRTNGQWRWKCFHLMTSSCWSDL